MTMRLTLAAMAAFLAVALFATEVVRAQLGLGLTIPEVAVREDGAVGYVGPGDLVSGAVAWWGLRCYNAAYSGNVADVTDSATGNTTGTRLKCAGGTVSALVSGSACTFVTGNACSSLAATCAAACNVATLYDQSGTNCGGACNATQATNASRPTLTLNCIGSLPCITATGSQSLNTPNQTGVNQPGTASLVALRNTNVGRNTILFLGACGFWFGPGATNTSMFCNVNEDTVSASPDGNVFSIVDVLNDAVQSKIYINGGAGTNETLGTTTTFVSNGTPANLLTSGFGGLTGNLYEAGIWSAAFNTTQADNMSANQRSYWGF